MTSKLACVYFKPDSRADLGQCHATDRSTVDSCGHRSHVPRAYEGYVMGCLYLGLISRDVKLKYEQDQH